MRASNWCWVYVFFEYLQEYCLRRVDYIIDIAVWTNLIFRLADFLIVSFLFDCTSREGDAVP